MFCCAIESGELSVQQYLENLGIVGGLDGLNFNTSTMFSSGELDDIHIRCYYRISLYNFVDRSSFDVPICKEAVITFYGITARLIAFFKQEDF